MTYMESEHDFADDNLAKNINIVEPTNMENPVKAVPSSQVEENSRSTETSAARLLQEKISTDPFVYREDVVSCSKYEGLLGVVMEVAGDSDSDGSITDDSDSEDGGDGNFGGAGGEGGEGTVINDTDRDDENDKLPDGQVRVAWIDGSETTDNIADITVVDRSFLHGDVVASANDPTGQLGLVVDVNITVDLRTADRELIKQISSKDLRRIREFAVGDYVVCGPWLGRVDDVLDNVTILFDDGSVCKVVKADPLRLQPVSKPVIEDSNCPYYPGQRIRAVSSSVFKSSRWLSGLWKANRLEGTVIRVQTASVIVYWIASAYHGISTNSSTVPSEEQNPKDLTLLNCFSYANWQLGDWCLIPSSSNVDGTSDGCNIKVPAEASLTRHSDDRSIIKAHMDIPMASGSGSSGNDLLGTDIVSKCCEPSEPPIFIADDLDETKCDSHEVQLLPGATNNSYDGNSASEESKCSYLMDSEKSLKPCESSVSNVLPAAGLNSSSTSGLKEVAHESWPSYRKKLRKVLFKRDKKGRRRDDTFEKALLIIKTITKVDVVWQDGTKEYGLDSTSLIPIQTPNDLEFFPEQYVVEKASDDDYSETKRVGIVKNLNAKERTVCVRWFKPVSRPEDAREFDCEEVVSAYELDEHPDYDYCYGDVVVRLSPVSSDANKINLGSPEVGRQKQSDVMDLECENQTDNDHEEQLFKDEVCEDFSSLSWVGNITGLQDGDIEITWADGMVSKVGPQAIYVVGRDDEGDSFGGASEVSDDGASWETVDENDNLTKEADLRDLTENDPAEENSISSPSDDSTTGGNGPLSMPLAALGFVARFATGLFSLGRKQSDSDYIVANGTEPQEDLKVLDRETPSEELSLVKADVFGRHSNRDLEGSNESNTTGKMGDADMTSGNNMDDSMPVTMSVDSTGVEDLSSFKHFDIVQDPFDHYYLGSSTQTTGGKKWVKKIQQEWSILEKNLPDAIFVRVFEERMDLLRAVIIGASGTPYQDGLFFFDFHLPPEYPQVPPSAYYHSGGLRVNPNLYVDGKVCLSLLNTWTGKGNEVWDPSSSSILQVLVSLQGLVLNSKPYFNEAGYEKQVGTIEGEKNSLPYNENTYLLNLKSMMYHLRRPPMHFEGFIRDHFRQRGYYILKACEAYMGDCMIGSLTRDACMTEKSKEHQCSVGFKLMLAKILPRMISALKEVGVDCSQFEYFLKSENLTRT